MRIKSIKLENIRSYLNEEIEFPEGSVLLSGDVGSGKSSILLAMEFALFGIRAKHLTGNSLLRNGKNTGSVALRFEIDGKDVLVKRTLKRSKDKVEQDSGYIIVDGLKREATAVELKTQILSLLGYPKELVTKTKNLVYRYTVYTPQEEMKLILSEEEEARIDTLRRVFGIDKYKKIRENSQIIVKELNDKIKILGIKTEDVEEKSRRKEEIKSKAAEIEAKINSIAPELLKIRERIAKSKEGIERNEQRARELYSLKKELEMMKRETQAGNEQKKSNTEEIEALERQIAELSKTAEKSIDSKSVRIQIKSCDDRIIFLEGRLKEARNMMREHQVMKRHSEDVKDNIIRLDKCNTCEQNVSKEHKELISRRENEKIMQYERLIHSLDEQIKREESELVKVKSMLDELREEEKSMEIAKIRMENLKEKKERRGRLLKANAEIERRITESNKNVLELMAKLEGLRNIEEEQQKLRAEMEIALNEEKESEARKRGFEREKELLAENISALEAEIEAKMILKKRMSSMMQLKNWVDEFFVKINTVMERQVMLSVHSEFNSLFKEWFGMLMEEEAISGRIDEQFTPVIEQNGYETGIENLSGGERTAAALAYRLALNKVVNDLTSGIKTKELIILDEPTDGFSSQQLDRIRDVLGQLGIKQTIIVSHESKIESFVDNVIRIGKNEHVSMVG